MRGFTDFKIVLNSIKAGTINDGVGDRTAEMYIEVNLKRNNQNIVSSQRWPEYDKRKHGGSSFSITTALSDNAAEKAAVPKVETVMFRLANETDGGSGMLH